MPWGRIDDCLYDHPKAEAAGLEAMGLWVLALSRCCRRKSDFMTHADVVRLTGDEATADRLAAVLVDVRLWHAKDSGFEIHDFEEYCPAIVPSPSPSPATPDAPPMSKEERRREQNRLAQATRRQRSRQQESANSQQPSAESQQRVSNSQQDLADASANSQLTRQQGLLTRQQEIAPDGNRDARACAPPVPSRPYPHTHSAGARYQDGLETWVAEALGAYPTLADAMAPDVVRAIAADAFQRQATKAVLADAARRLNAAVLGGTVSPDKLVAKAIDWLGNPFAVHSPPKGRTPSAPAVAGPSAPSRPEPAENIPPQWERAALPRPGGIPPDKAAALKLFEDSLTTKKAPTHAGT